MNERGITRVSDAIVVVCNVPGVESDDGHWTGSGEEGQSDELNHLVTLEEEGQVGSSQNEHATPYSTIGQIDHIFVAVNRISHNLIEMT